VYGKHFSSMYEGSMIGAGLNVFAVWGYIISHADFNDSCVELHPKHLALILGCSKEEVVKAIEYLMAPDPDSKSKEEEGRRLLKKGEYLYFVVNFKRYRTYKTTSDRRSYNREYMRSYRKDSVKHCKKKFTLGEVYASVSVSDSDSSLNAKDKDKIKSRIIFTPPTLDELSAYVLQHKYSFDPEKFIAHYESNGWLVGKNKMKNWKAACVTWQKGNYNSKPYQTASNRPRIEV